MINKKIEKYIKEDTSCIVIPVSNISMVFEENNLAHAMLILKESNYTQIPVLNYDKKFTGLISFHHIYKILGEKLFDNFDNFDNYYVKDFIDTHNASVKEDFELEDVLNLLINYNFINVLSNDGKLVGMITRSSVLKIMNYLVHNIDKIME